MFLFQLDLPSSFQKNTPPKKKSSPSFLKVSFLVPLPHGFFFLSPFSSLSKRTQKNPQNTLQKNPKEKLKTWKHGMWGTLCPPLLLLFFFFYLFDFFFFDFLYFFNVFFLFFSFFFVFEALNKKNNKIIK